MTRTTAPAPAGIPTPGRVIASGLITLAMTIACVNGLSALVVPGPWRWTVAAMLTAVAAVSVTSRIALRRWRGPDVGTAASLMPSLAGLATAAWLVTARFGGSNPRATSGDLNLLVSRDDIEGLTRLGRAVEEIAITTMAPIQPLEAIVALFAAGACLVFVLMDMFVAVRVPALVGLATSLLWLPSLMIVGEVATWSVVTVTALLLVLLAVDRPTVSADGPRPASRYREVAVPFVGAALTITSVVAGGVIVAMLLPSLPGRGAITAPDLRSGVANLTDDLDLRRSLQEQSTREVLTYTVSQGAPPVGPFRTTSILDFDGRQWLPSDNAGAPARAGDLLWPSIADGSAASSFALRMQFEGLNSSTLPVPLEPRMVTSDRGLSYDADRDTVELDERVSNGDALEMTVMPRDLDPDLLRSRSTLAAPGRLGFPGSSDILERALALPATSHGQDVERLARAIAGSADNRYDAAIAIQDHLRTSPDFRYSLNVPEPTSDDAVWDFLQDGTGYCVQFASAMTIMARTLGIPARMSIGYLPGSFGSDGVAVVRGKDAHAWPEVYFDDVGWVRFEPTPATQSGVLPEYAATPTGRPTPSATTTAPPTRTSTRPTQSGATSSSSSNASSASASSQSNGGLVALLALLACVGGAVTTMLVRRHRARLRVRDVEEAWATLLRRATKSGMAIDPAATVRATAHVIDPHDGAAHELSRLVEQARYAPTTNEVDRSTLEVLVGSALEALDARLAADASPDEGA